MRRILSKLRHPVRLFQSSKPDPAHSAVEANAGASRIVAVPRSSVPVPVPEGPEAELVRDSPQLNAPLENLPPEIRRQVLSILELKDLSALVHASPVFHQQYLLDRRSLLCKCLDTTLRSVTIDAYTVYRSGLADFSDTRTREGVTQFLKLYQDRRSSTRYSILTERLTEDEAVDMVVFLSSVIKPLARHYTDWALSNLANETKGSQSRELLSRTEETRLMRALYRFQLCCNLFGKGSHEPFRQPSFQSVDILKIFICIFEPWEVEEIACIYTFAKDKYDQIFRDIRWDVHEENPKFEGQRPPTPEGAFDLDNSCQFCLPSLVMMDQQRHFAA